jgi:hypothetical protein
MPPRAALEPLLLLLLAGVQAGVLLVLLLVLLLPMPGMLVSTSARAARNSTSLRLPELLPPLPLPLPLPYGVLSL